MIVGIKIELDDSNGRMAVFAPMETIEQRMDTALILNKAIEIVLRHEPPKVLKPAPGILDILKNGNGKQQ